MKIKETHDKKKKGFTIVELLVSIAIFALMTALLLSKYGTFNQGVILTNLAYDVALTIRNAQSYGLNVKSASRDSDLFSYPYGVHFDSSSANNTKFIFFADVNSNGLYDVGTDTIISQTTITRGSKISILSRPDGGSINPLDISYKRPDPNAIIYGNNNTGTAYTSARIQIMASDGVSIKTISVSSNGQISVQ